MKVTSKNKTVCSILNRRTTWPRVEERAIYKGTVKTGLVIRRLPDKGYCQHHERINEITRTRPSRRAALLFGGVAGKENYGFQGGRSDCLAGRGVHGRTLYRRRSGEADVGFEPRERRGFGDSGFGRFFWGELHQRTEHVFDVGHCASAQQGQHHQAKSLLLLARSGDGGKLPAIFDKINQDTLAEMVGTTRSRINFFMNKFRKLGFIHYNGGLKVHNSLARVLEE